MMIIKNSDAIVQCIITLIADLKELSCELDTSSMYGNSFESMLSYKIAICHFFKQHFFSLFLRLPRNN